VVAVSLADSGIRVFFVKMLIVEILHQLLDCIWCYSRSYTEWGFHIENILFISSYAFKFSSPVIVIIKHSHKV